MQIVENVDKQKFMAQLQPVWTWRSGDMRGNKTQNQCNPLMVDGVLYVTTPGLAVAALDQQVVQ